MQCIAEVERNDGGELQIMYGIDGRRELTDLGGTGQAAGTACELTRRAKRASSGLDHPNRVMTVHPLL